MTSLREAGAITISGGDYDRWDFEVRGGLLGSSRARVAVEEHGAGRQLVRMRWWPRASRLGLAFCALCLGLLAAAALSHARPIALAASACSRRSRWDGYCWRPAGHVAPLAAPWRSSSERPQPTGSLARRRGRDRGDPHGAGRRSRHGCRSDEVEPAVEAEPPRTSFRRQLTLLRYLRPYWRAVIVVLASMLAEVGLQLLRPWPLKVLVDNVLGGHPIPSGITTVTGATSPSALLPWVVSAEVAIFLLGTAAGMVYTFTSSAWGSA